MSVPVAEPSLPPFILASIGRNLDDFGGFDDEAFAVRQNLYGSIEETKETLLPRADTLSYIGDGEICRYLQETALYDIENRRWVQFPIKPPDACALDQVVQNTIEDVISIILEKRNGSQRVSRSVVECRTKRLATCSSESGYASPPLAICATGPSFEVPTNEGGFTNIATCIELDVQAAMRSPEDQVAQLGVYAKQIMMQQPNREFVRCLYMTENSARLLHYDYAGAQHGPLVDIHQDPVIFVRYIIAVSTFDEAELGFDTSIVWKHKDGKKLPGFISVVNENDVCTRYPMRDSDPCAGHTEIVSRGLRVWQVCHPRTRQKLVIKDSWVGPGRTAEWENLLLAKGLPGVVQVVSMESRRFRFTDTFRAAPVKPSAHHRAKSRIVLVEVGERIVDCKDERIFLSALRDAIAGLQGLEGVGLLHRDISSGNLLLGNEGATPGDRGVLIDLDLAFPATELSEERNYSCGTPEYMSINVLLCGFDDKFRLGYVRDHLDDLESVFYVMLEAMYGWEELGCPAFVKALSDTWDDPQDAVEARRHLFSMDTLDTSHVGKDFGHEAQGVIQSFFKFLRGILKAKNKISTIKETKEKLAGWQCLIGKKDEHYFEILSNFDKALRKLDQRTASSPQKPDSSTPTTASRKPLNSLQLTPPGSPWVRISATSPVVIIHGNCTYIWPYVGAGSPRRIVGSTWTSVSNVRKPISL